jgi:hypothetical protein
MPGILHTTRDRFRALRNLYKPLVAQRNALVFSAVALGLASAIVDGIGLSLIYPLLSSVLGREPIGSGLWSYISSIAGAFSSGSITEGLIYMVSIVFFIKALLLLASAGMSTLLVGRLREDWSLAVLGSYLNGPYADIVAERRGRIMQKVAGEAARGAKGIEQLINLFVHATFAIVLVATLVLLNWKIMLSLCLE